MHESKQEVTKVVSLAKKKKKKKKKKMDEKLYVCPAPLIFAPALSFYMYFNFCIKETNEENYIT